MAKQRLIQEVIMKTINFEEFEVQLQKMKKSLKSNIINLKNEMESIV